MHILHVISSLECGGAQRALLTQITHDTQHTHSVAYVHDGPYRQQLTACGVTVVCVKGWLSAYSPLALWRLCRVVRQLQPAIIHTSLWLAGVIGRLVGVCAGVPVVCDVHSNARYHGMVRNMIDRMTRMGATYCAVTPQIAHAAQKHAGVVPATVIANGIDSAIVRTRGEHYQYTRAMFGMSADTFVVGSVGRLVSIKRYEIMLRAHAQCVQQEPSLRMATVLVGQGPEKENLMALAAELGIANSVYFVGARDDVYGLYPLFDCFCLPSYAEGLSYALLEALCFGLPAVVSQDAAGDGVVVHGTHGYVVPRDDHARSYAAHLIALWGDTALRQKIKDKNIALVSHFFAPSSMVARYNLLYKRVRSCMQVNG